MLISTRSCRMLQPMSNSDAVEGILTVRSEKVHLEAIGFWYFSSKKQINKQKYPSALLVADEISEFGGMR